MLITFVLYQVYSAIRNLSEGTKETAFRHARQLMDWQSTLGINHEQTLQSWALNSRPLIVLMNYIYGSLHFIVTAGAVIFLYRKFPGDYPRWRNTLALTTILALIGFVFWPLMPPRLLHPTITASSTPWPGTRRSGRSTRAPSTRSRTSTRRCPACTSAGRCSAPRRWLLGYAAGRPGSPPPSTRC